jgi:adsorption protein B
MLFGMSGHDWLVLWRDICLALTWSVAIVFLLSGMQDLIYDIGAYLWRLYKRFAFSRRERLSLQKLRAREQQRIAIFIPAWNEGEVVGHMVANILKRVEYRNYVIFVGTYPNDPSTQNAVDALTRIYPEVIKVVTGRPGPTNKAHCLNTVYHAMKEYEQRHDVHFDIMAMHDAEDVVHPYAFLLFNYLIPRVDAVQLPILPLPAPLSKWVHWIYADEFAEVHMKDVIVREQLSGFVPFAGVGTAFSRRGLTLIDQENDGALFNEGSLTEDYSMAKRMRELGLKTVFVNLVLGDDKSAWHTPLLRRPGFIANWAFFPMDFTRSVRQKTRWIIGISLQEWEQRGWRGNLLMIENLVKDRKVFVAATTSLVAYLLFAYFVVYQLGDMGLIPLKLLPFIFKDSPVYTLVVIDTVFMFLRMLERIIFVGMVYGLGQGLMSIPRLVLGNVINGLAAFRSLQTYLESRVSTRRLTWDKTMHEEGVGSMPTDHAEMVIQRPARKEYAEDEILRLLKTMEPVTVMQGLEAIPRDCPPEVQVRYVIAMSELVGASSNQVRGVVARVSGFLRWPALTTVIRTLLTDREWMVRANAARALLKFPDFERLLPVVFAVKDGYAWEALIRALESDEPAQRRLLPTLQQDAMVMVRGILLSRSLLIRRRYQAMVEGAGDDQHRVPVTLLIDRTVERIPAS